MDLWKVEYRNKHWPLDTLRKWAIVEARTPFDAAHLLMHWMLNNGRHLNDFENLKLVWEIDQARVVADDTLEALLILAFNKTCDTWITRIAHPPEGAVLHMP